MQLDKYVFRIRTRNGALMEHLMIQAATEADARARLVRMYPGCEVLSSRTETTEPGHASRSFEDLADLLNEP